MPLIAPPGVAGPAVSPLTPQHLRELAEANERARKLRRMIAVATFNGWTIGACALLTVLCGIVDRGAFLLGVGMSVVAYCEFRGAARLRRLDPAAARWLGCDQLGLAGLLIIYALWQMAATLLGPAPYAEYVQAEPQLAGMLGPMEQITRTILLLVYGGLIGFAVVFQGGTAWYYFARAKHIRAYIEKTPAWIIQLQQSGIHLPG